MKNIITAIIAIIGAAGGTFAAKMLIPGSSAAESHAGEHGDKDDHAKASKKKDGHGKSDTSGANTSFFNFSREFVVPLLSDGKVDSLVLINMSLEITPELSGKMFSMEPKLRDNIMSTLVGLSGDDETFRKLTTVRNYESIRSLVLANLQSSISKDIKAVLIMDIARQDI